MPSVIHEIPGLPVGFGDTVTEKTTYRQWRVYLITAWTEDDIVEARRKVREGNILPIQCHYGTIGVQCATGDLWWSFVAHMPVECAKQWRGAAMPPRYGLKRWRWTDAD